MDGRRSQKHQRKTTQKLTCVGAIRVNISNEVNGFKR